MQEGKSTKMSERTEPAAPFKFTTVDLFGPYQVQDDAKKQVRLKVWGVVFCCMASRAIHTELVNSLATKVFSWLTKGLQRSGVIPGKSGRTQALISNEPVSEELCRFLDSLDKAGLAKFAPN